jgi:hypothetical protein
MKAGFIQDTIKKNNRRRLVIGFILIGLILISFCAFIRYYYNFVMGPFEVDRTKLLNAERAGAFFEYYVNIQGDEIYDTGFVYVTVSDSGTETTDYYYYALEIGRELMLVESTEEIDTANVTGFIKSIPNNIEEEVLGELIEETPSLQAKFMPIMLKVNNFRTAGWIGIALGIIVGTIGVIIIGITLLHIASPESHPIMKSLKTFGNPKIISQEIDSDLAGETYQDKQITITDHWLIQVKGVRFSITRFEDVIWCYKRVVQHRTYGVPTGKNFYALVYDRHNNIITIQAKDESINNFLSMIAMKAPWAIKGYSDDVMKLYKKNRQVIIDKVNQNKSSLQK